MKSRALPVLALLLLPAPAAAQISRNAKLLAQFRPIQATNYYNDIWGYVAGGREHAILGVSNGTYFIDCSVPSSLKVRAMISYSAGGSGWRPSGWRDIKSYGSYAYIVTEGGGGMQIVDLRNPLAPTIVKTWGGSIWTHAHNIAMDQENGIAYVCGTSSVIGAHVIDVKTDPVNPKLITSYRGSYVHDLHIQQGYAHLAEIYTNLYRIIDVSKLPSIRSVAAVRTTGLRYAHATWATWDTNYCLTTNEAAGGPIGVWDIRTKTSPRLIASYTAGPASAIPHNVFIRDRVGHFSYYTEGYRSVDLSDPSKPVEVAWYDTWPNASSGYNGNWGCYPFSPSGTIYASDRTYGMFVIKPKSAVAYYGGDT
ncbi:MAG: LVIVD repeat-containing protein, partial [Planctomycetota bacterium]